jgi:hypothetical protein
MYIPRNWEFGSVLTKLRNFGGGGMKLPNPPRYATVLDCPHYVQLIKRYAVFLLLPTQTNIQFCMPPLSQSHPNSACCLSASPTPILSAASQPVSPQFCLPPLGQSHPNSACRLSASLTPILPAASRPVSPQFCLSPLSQSHPNSACRLSASPTPILPSASQPVPPQFHVLRFYSRFICCARHVPVLVLFV